MHIRTDAEAETDEEPRGSRFGGVIAIIGFMVFVIGLIAYLYVVEFQVGFLISTVYPHRDLGTVLIPTGVVVMLAGIVHYVFKRH